MVRLRLGRRSDSAWVFCFLGAIGYHFLFELFETSQLLDWGKSAHKYAPVVRKLNASKQYEVPAPLRQLGEIRAFDWGFGEPDDWTLRRKVVPAAAVGFLDKDESFVPPAYIITANATGDRFRTTAVRVSAIGQQPIPHVGRWPGDDMIRDATRRMGCLTKYVHFNAWRRFAEDPAYGETDYAFFYEDDIAFSSPMTPDAVHRGWRSALKEPSVARRGVLYLGLCVQKVSEAFVTGMDPLPASGVAPVPPGDGIADGLDDETVDVEYLHRKAMDALAQKIVDKMVRTTPSHTPSRSASPDPKRAKMAAAAAVRPGVQPSDGLAELLARTRESRAARLRAPRFRDDPSTGAGGGAPPNNAPLPAVAAGGQIEALLARLEEKRRAGPPPPPVPALVPALQPAAAAAASAGNTAAVNAEDATGAPEEAPPAPASGAAVPAPPPPPPPASAAVSGGSGGGIGGLEQQLQANRLSASMNRFLERVRQRRAAAAAAAGRSLLETTHDEDGDPTAASPPAFPSHPPKPPLTLGPFELPRAPYSWTEKGGDGKEVQRSANLTLRTVPSCGFCAHAYALRKDVARSLQRRLAQLFPDAASACDYIHAMRRGRDPSGDFRGMLYGDQLVKEACRVDWKGMPLLGPELRAPDSDGHRGVFYQDRGSFHSIVSGDGVSTSDFRREAWERDEDFQ